MGAGFLDVHARIEFLAVPFRFMTRPSNIPRLFRCGLDALLASVGILFRACRPSTVSGFVISIVADSVQRSSVWTHSHIGKERFKRSPLWMNSNTSSTVVEPPIIRRITATLNHAQPRLVGCASAASAVFVFVMAGLAVSAFKCCPIAPAAFCLAASQSPTVYVDELSAIASAAPKPCTASGWVWCSLNCFKSSESLPGQIDRVRRHV